MTWPSSTTAKRVAGRSPASRNEARGHLGEVLGALVVERDVDDPLAGAARRLARDLAVRSRRRSSRRATSTGPSRYFSVPLTSQVTSGSSAGATFASRPRRGSSSRSCRTRPAAPGVIHAGSLPSRRARRSAWTRATARRRRRSVGRGRPTGCPTVAVAAAPASSTGRNSSFADDSMRASVARRRARPGSRRRCCRPGC